MSSIQLCAAHQATAAFDGDAIAQYMRTDFITLPEHFSVHEARELFVSQLASDEIPGQVFVVAGKKLRGSCFASGLTTRGRRWSPNWQSAGSTSCRWSKKASWLAA